MYAVLSKYNIILVEILIHLNFVIFFYFYKQNPQAKIFYQFKVIKIDVYVFIGIFIFLLLFNFEEITNPLFGDEIAPIRRSVRTSYFLSMLSLNTLNISFLDKISLKYFIQLLNLSQIIFLFIIFKFYKFNKNYYFLFIILLLSFILRLIIKDGVHHPPLNHIFSTSLISIFGLNHTVARLSYFFPFFFFLFALFIQIRKIFDKKNSFLFLITLSTFPILNLASLIPDHSIWSAMIFIYLLIYISVNNKIDYQFCLLIISIGILFRITVFTSLLLLLLVYLKDFFIDRKILKKDFKSLIIEKKIYIYFLLFLPLLIVSLDGTPAYEGIANVNTGNYFIEAFKSKIILNTLILQIPPWYYFFIIFIYFSKYRFAILLFFLFNLVIYFSIHPDLWGNAKYALEFGVPFFIIGYFLLSKLLFRKNYIISLLIINLSVISLNILDLYKFPSNRISVDKIIERGYQYVFKSTEKDKRYLLKLVYDYDEAFDYLSKHHKYENTIFLGTTYGFLPQIIEGYNFNQIKKIIHLKNDFDNYRKEKTLSNKIFEITKLNNFKDTLKLYLKLQKNKKVVVKNLSSDEKEEFQSNYNHYSNEENVILNINNINNLEFIILSDYNNEIIVTLKKNNWVIHREFKNKRYGSTLILLKKLKN